ncbi:MAG: hypothetical protein ACOCSL_00620 [Thermoplasmatota archaeon]
MSKPLLRDTQLKNGWDIALLYGKCIRGLFFNVSFSSHVLEGYSDEY